MIFLDQVAYAEIGALREAEKPGRSSIVCVGVGTLVLGEACGAIPPTRGVDTLVAYGKWVDVTPAFTPAAGAFLRDAPPSTTRGCRWRLDRNRTWQIEGRIDMPASLGTAAGPLSMSLPVTVASGGWEPGVVYDEAGGADWWVISAASGKSVATIRCLGHPRDLVAGAALFFSLGGEAAP